MSARILQYRRQIAAHVLIYAALANGEPVATRYRIEQSANGEYSIAFIYPGTDPNADDSGSQLARNFQVAKADVYGERGTMGNVTPLNRKQGFDGKTVMVAITRNRDPRRGYQGPEDFAPERIVNGLACFLSDPLPLEARLASPDLPENKRLPMPLAEAERLAGKTAGKRVEMGMFFKREGQSQALSAQVIAMMEGELDTALRLMGGPAGGHVARIYLQTDPGKDPTKLRSNAALYQRAMNFQEAMRVPLDPHIHDGRGVAIMWMEREDLRKLPEHVGRNTDFENHPVAHRRLVATQGDIFRPIDCGLALGGLPGMHLPAAAAAGSR